MPKQFLKSFADGDEDSYAWSTRVPKGANQWLLDLMAEEQFPNKSQTLKRCVEFAYTHYAHAADLFGKKLSERFRARTEFDNADREAKARQEILADLNRRLALINTTDHAATRAKLIATARMLAAAHDMEWPPPELPLVAYDEDANYIRNRIIELIEQSDNGRVSMRDLVMRSLGDTAKVTPVVERLEEAGYITTHKEHRSGPATVWIAIPTLKITKDTEKGA